MIGMSIFPYKKACAHEERRFFYLFLAETVTINPTVTLKQHKRSSVDALVSALNSMFR